MRPAKEMKTGAEIVRSMRVWYMIDTLLTSATTTTLLPRRSDGLARTHLTRKFSSRHASGGPLENAGCGGYEERSLP